MKRSAGKTRYLAFVVVSLYAGCAEVGAPPGGPIDQTAPIILETTPSNGARGVPPGNRVTIVFSERIVRPTTGQPVFVSPRPEIAPDVQWKSDRIIVTLADSFKTDQTYLVSVAPTVGDLRGNKLDSTVTIAFTTGQLLDSGRISGHVLQKDKGVAAAMVGLYPRSVLADTAALDSLVPRYAAVTNAEGYFSFSYLSSDSFLLVAWKDQNRDEALNPGRENYAVPDRPVGISDLQPFLSGITLPMNEKVVPLPWRDTTRAGIISSLYTEDGLVRVRFAQPEPLSLLTAQPGNALLLPVGDTLRAIPANGLLEAGEKEVTALTLYFGPLAAGAYNLRVTTRADRPTLGFDSVLVETREDRIPPRVETTTPEDPTVFLRDAAVSMTFTEPLDRNRITDETFTLWQDDSIPVPVGYVWRDPFRLQFTAQLAAGRTYRLNATEFDLVDLAGNPLGDSLLVHRFGIFDDDSLGSIAGTIQILPEHRKSDPAVLRFNLVGRSEFYSMTSRTGSFRIDLPAGKYLITAFLDSNLDGELTNGELAPYRMSETRMSMADTIAVRARFETAGVELTFE
ncbi:MAG: Ig-like domain-containing protein [candidate division Zixibacteria bacterium]|nr:Ig-like domain-containing protein [candidate division Zixibacteria bacterium]